MMRWHALCRSRRKASMRGWLPQGNACESQVVYDCPAQKLRHKTPGLDTHTYSRNLKLQTNGMRVYKKGHMINSIPLPASIDERPVARSPLLGAGDRSGHWQSSRDPRALAAVDRQHDAGDEFGVVGGKEHGGSRDIPGRPHLAHGDHGVTRGDHLFNRCILR